MPGRIRVRVYDEWYGIDDAIEAARIVSDATSVDPSPTGQDANQDADFLLKWLKALKERYDP
jgi:hypothetical protein